MDFSSVGSTDWRRILVVALAVVIVVVIVLMLLGIRIWPFGSTASAPAPREIVLWKKPDPAIPLRVTKADLGKGGLEFDRYTMLVEMVWLNTRATDSTANYRHILHRGSGEGADYLQRMGGIREVGTSAGMSVGASATEVLRRMPQGLPIRMNPGIMADPVKNDMILFFDTEAENQNLRESVRIPDLPMDQPFRLAVVVMPTLVEVYINCRLEVTKLLEGRPRTIEDTWYGLIGPQPLRAQVQNLRLLTGVLGPSQIQSYCKAAPIFPEGGAGCEERQIQSQASAAIAGV